MPRTAGVSVPKYRNHKASGQAIVTIQGRDHYLGPWKSKASRIEYDRLISVPRSTPLIFSFTTCSPSVLNLAEPDHHSLDAVVMVDGAAQDAVSSSDSLARSRM